MEYRYPKDDIITLGISLLKFVGEFTTYKSQLPINIYRFFNCVVMIVNVILLLANLPKADGQMYVQIIGSFAQAAHGLLRYICFVYYKSEIFSLLNDMELFWNIKQIKHIHRMAKKAYVVFGTVQKLFLVLAIFGLVAYSFKPLAEEEGLIFPSGIVVDFIGFEAALLFSQYYFIIIITAIVIGYDIIYVCYSAHVIIQIRMLNYRFEHITGDMDIETINSYIRHHQFILNIFDRMKRIYFWMFFFLYGLTLLSGCSQLYLVILRDTSISDLLGPIIYITALFFEFGLYTSIVEAVVSELTDVATSVYKSSWYERTLEDRKVLLVIMMKGQRQGYFSAGGLADINVDAFGSVVRKIFSFYAILRNILNK